jgi:coatomer subunit beta'
VPEAAFFARTYAPASVSTIVARWKAELSETNAKAAEALADPLEFSNLFPDFEWALAAEKQWGGAAAQRKGSSSFVVVCFC